MSSASAIGAAACPAAYDVVFLNIYEGGRSYTDGEYRNWLEAGGFDGIKRVLLANSMSLITAHKR